MKLKFKLLEKKKLSIFSEQHFIFSINKWSIQATNTFVATNLIEKETYCMFQACFNTSQNKRNSVITMYKLEKKQKELFTKTEHKTQRMNKETEELLKINYYSPVQMFCFLLFFYKSQQDTKGWMSHSPKSPKSRIFKHLIRPENIWFINYTFFFFYSMRKDTGQDLKLSTVHNCRVRLKPGDEQSFQWLSSNPRQPGLAAPHRTAP